MIKCGAQCENIELQMGVYHLKMHMLIIEMGGCDVVLCKMVTHLGTCHHGFQGLLYEFHS